jgi:hypothetical protein
MYRRLSEIVKSAIICRGVLGTPDILKFKVEDTWYSRTVKYEYFSNYPIVTIRFNNERYLVDTSCVEVKEVANGIDV